MGLFNKQPKAVICDMCGKSVVDGCGAADKHVEQISGDQPAWLPGNLRAQAPGEYTWLCTRCHSFPALKWPGDGGAHAGLMIHLGSAHYIGIMRGTRQEFSMIPADQ
jgi:hypothetical protein